MALRDIQEVIRQYLEGTMTSQEKTDFETKISQSKELAEQVNQVRLLRIFNKNKNLIEAKALLKSVMAETPLEPDNGKYEKYFKKSFWGTAAFAWLLGSLTVVLLIGGTVFYQKNQAAKAISNLSKNYLQHMENIINFSPNDPLPAAKAMRAYDSKNYAEASVQLKNALMNSADDNSLRLYLAISYLMQGQNVEAEMLFQSIIETKDAATIVPAQWYLALSLLQHGQKAEAKMLLQSLETDTTYGNQAKAILKQL